MTYNATKIADELTKTALGEAYYGNALYVALDFPFLTDEDKRVLRRYLHGANCGRDSHALQDIAIAIIEKAKEICVYPQSTGCRAQATPISSQMMTMERMISERDDTIASMHRENVNLTAQRDELLAAVEAKRDQIEVSKQHTREPWSFCVDDADGVGRLLNDLSNNEIAHVFDHEAGRRIVACVNACKRFNTELLEAAAACGGITEDPTAMLLQAEQQRDELQTAYDGAHSELVRMTDQLAACRNVANELSQQRDELLTAMEAFVSRFDNIGESPLLPTISDFRAVIARVKP